MPPRRKRAPEPTYPATLKSRSQEGEVELEVKVGPDGSVMDVKVVRPATEVAFNDAAVESARMSTYEPARLGASTVEYAIRFTVRFRLREGKP